MNNYNNNNHNKIFKFNFNPKGRHKFKKLPQKKNKIYLNPFRINSKIINKFKN